MQKETKFANRFWLIYCLAWIPYALSYVAVFFTQGNSNVTSVLITVFQNIIPAAVLGLVVIWICNKLNWALHRKIWFFPLHILFALIYSSIWTFLLFLLLTSRSYFITGTWSPVSFIGNALQWQMFSGMMLYATIASIIYVLQVVQTLREEERRTARAETLYAQNSLAVLQAQLNPHFLFNTLHSLMALVRYDAEKAENALEKLAEMLRYSIKDKRDSRNFLVRLEDELSFVENYLELEKLRLSDRLTIKKNIEKETLDCHLPAFTIQPLVENSIKHGIAPKNISATIIISTEKENDFLKIEVEDDGIGSNSEKVEESDGLGINLIREQLQINYGDNCIFEIDTNLNQGFKTRIKIPIQYAEK